MALYGVTQYGTDVYGLSLPPAYMCTPFTARSTDYGTIRLTWKKCSGDVFRYRVITNRYGYPVSQNDGTIVIDSVAYPGSSYLDRQVIPGSYHYYGIYVLADEVNDIWICGGVTACLAIAGFGSAGQMLDLMPEFFKSDVIDGSELTGDTSGDTYLQQFMNVLGWGLDYVRTQYAATAQYLNDPMNCSLADLWNMAAGLGLSFSPQVPAYTVRKAVANWAHVCRERGTQLGLRNEVDLRTGWGADITNGVNIMLQNDQSLLLGPVYLPYQPRCYQVEEICWYAIGHSWTDWTHWQWPGYGYWYKCIQVCPPGPPPGDGSSTGYWQCVTDADDFLFGMVNPRTGGPSTWEVMAPAQPGSLLAPGSVKQGLGVLAPNGNGHAWNTLRFYNTAGSTQTLQCRSLSRGTSYLGKMPDPSFEAGYTIPAQQVCASTPWVPSHWPQVLFGQPGYPGQWKCGGHYNATAFWTFTNCTFERSQAAAHTGTWGVAISPDVTGTTSTCEATSPWITCPAASAVTGSLYVQAPAVLAGPQINLLPDPEFAQGTGGFAVAAPPTTYYGQTETGAASIAQSTAAPYDSGLYSPYALAFTSNLEIQSAAYASAVTGPAITVTPGLSYTFSAELEGTAITAIALQWFNANGTVLSSVTHANVNSGTYASVALTGTAPSGAVAARFTATFGAAGYIAHCYFGLTTSASTVTPLLFFADQNGGAASTVTGSPVTLSAGTWTQLNVSGTSPAGTQYCYVGFIVENITPADVLWLDDCAIANGAPAVSAVPDPSVVLADGIDVPWVRPSQAWKSGTRYGTGDLVGYNGQPFKALRASTGITPPGNFAASAEWAPLSENERIRLCVSAYVSQNLTNSGTYQYPVVPYVEWYDSNGVYITRILARSTLNNGTAGKPNNLAFDSFTGQSRVESQTLTAASIGPWQATFYANETLTGPFCFQRWDPFINFFWGFAPVEFVGTTGWSASWTCTYTPNTTGVFTFELTAAQGGSRFIVNGQTVVNNWTGQSGSGQTVTLDLVAGTPVTFEVDYTSPLTPFTEEFGPTIFPFFQPEWEYGPWPPYRFVQWNTVARPVIAGYPFQCLVQTLGSASRGQLTWYRDGTPAGVSEVIYAEEGGLVTITGTVPDGCNYVTMWCSESGGHCAGPRSQVFQHQLVETVPTALSLPNPTISASTGNTQFTASLAGRYTDDEGSNWAVPTGAFTVGQLGGGATWPATKGQRSIALLPGPASTSLGVTFRSSPQSGQSMGICFRYSSSNSYFRCDQTALRLNNAGTWTVLATHSTPFAPDDRMVVVLNGSSISVYRNNNMTTPVSTATSTVNQTATSHGLIVENT